MISISTVANTRKATQNIAEYERLYLFLCILVFFFLHYLCFGFQFFMRTQWVMIREKRIYD